MIMENLEIRYIKTGDLLPYARNARTHSDVQVNQIASSIKEFGFNNPILVDGNNQIIAGHGRLLACEKLGITEVPTVCLEHLSETQKRAYILADNQLALKAGWDEELLKLEIQELQGLDFDISIAGFDSEDLAGIFPVELQSVEDDNEADIIPETPTDPITKTGDTWLLGQFTYCPKCNAIHHVE
ncbi:MAG: hypothetical protein D3925_01395 [Candidatus Electrothrix sp. AR5]|nr:hypothetical protein [Candidatus Electrothrix sp. AR5]